MKDKVVVITGGSRGIGRGIALEFADLGAKIVINYRRHTKELEEVIEIIKEKGGQVLAVQADISIEDQAEKLMKTTKDHFGSLDILVNNAGITRDNLLMRMSADDFNTVIDTNLKGLFFCVKYASTIMLRQRSGKIINLSSVVGIVGNAGQANYSASKAGVIGLTKSAAKELASRGITVNAVAPGFIETDMTDSLSYKIKDAAREGIPLKRFGKINEVAGAVTFLASQAANYITGQVLVVDGGMVM